MAKYFSDSEFRRCTPPCSISEMSGEFLDVLDKVRARAGIPLVVNSAYRTKAYELSHGRDGSSSHCQGKAVDIRCNTSMNRFRILRAALDCGVTRIGIGKTFIHLDIATDRVQQVVFDYYT